MLVDKLTSDSFSVVQVDAESASLMVKSLVLDTHAGIPSVETSNTIFMKPAIHLLHPHVSLKKVGPEHHFSAPTTSSARAGGAIVVDGHFAKRGSATTTYFGLRQDCYV